MHLALIGISAEPVKVSPMPLDSAPRSRQRSRSGSPGVNVTRAIVLTRGEARLEEVALLRLEYSKRYIDIYRLNFIIYGLSDGYGGYNIANAITRT